MLDSVDWEKIEEKIMRKIFIAGLLVIMVSGLSAEQIYLDTKISMRLATGSMLSRESRIEVKAFGDMSVGVVHSVIDGLGLMGTLDSYRVGIYAAYPVKLPGAEVTPFVGLSYNTSLVISGELGADFGIRAYLTSLPLSPAICFFAQSFSDSTSVDFFVGPSFSLGFITLDLGYAPNLFILHDTFSLSYTSSVAGRIVIRL